MVQGLRELSGTQLKGLVHPVLQRRPVTSGRRTAQQVETQDGPLEMALGALSPPRVRGVGGLQSSPHHGTHGSGGANEAVFPPTHKDSDGWLTGRKQVLAHGPLGRVENSMSFNVTVGHSDCWALRIGVRGLWCAVKGIPERTHVSPAPICVTGRWNSKVRKDITTKKSSLLIL